VFEYDSSPQRSLWFYIGGILYLVAAFLVQDAIAWTADRFGKPAAALIPGSIGVFIAGIQFAMANRKRERLLECSGRVLHVELLPPISESGKRRFVPSKKRLTIRYLPADGALHFTEATGDYFYDAGDSIVMLYEPGHSDLAMPREAWNSQLYEEYLGFGCMGVLYLLAGTVVLWLFF
jgi:hypothetical protein